MKSKLKKLVKENYGYLILVFLIYIAFFLRFPYYIDAPGGIVDVSERIEVDNSYKQKGSFNLAYVSEYNASIYTMIISFFNKDWKIIKKSDVLLDNETNEEYIKRDKLLMEESISDAVLVAYSFAKKDIDIINSGVYVAYIYETDKNNLNIGDKIKEINDNLVSNKQDIKNILAKCKKGERLKIKVENKSGVKEKYANLIEYNNELIIGVMVVDIKEYETHPKIRINTKKRESGPSGGLMLSLSIYNSLVKEDITKGRTIVGTGTIDDYGNVGSIGGVEYKLKSAVKEHADLFIVPIGENYNDAIKIKNKNNYVIKIIGVKTFSEALDYLTK